MSYLQNKSIITKHSLRTRIFLAGIFLACLVFSCKKNNHPIDGNASFTLVGIEADPELSGLLPLYSGMNFTGGVGGVLIFRNRTDGAIDDFAAFDRACPHEANSTCRVNWTSDSPFYAECPCCGSKFNLITNGVETGPASFPLYIYNCDFTGGSIYVY
jgi:nitrite reductase/ring-hydroxylating ferredoxin subunit